MTDSQPTIKQHIAAIREVATDLYGEYPVAQELIERNCAAIEAQLDKLDASQPSVDIRELAEETGIRVEFAFNGKARLVQIIDIIHAALIKARGGKE